MKNINLFQFTTNELYLASMPAMYGYSRLFANSAEEICIRKPNKKVLMLVNESFETCVNTIRPEFHSQIEIILPIISDSELLRLIETGRYSAVIIESKLQVKQEISNDYLDLLKNLNRAAVEYETIIILRKQSSRLSGGDPTQIDNTQTEDIKAMEQTVREWLVRERLLPDDINLLESPSTHDETGALRQFAIKIKELLGDDPIILVDNPGYSNNTKTNTERRLPTKKEIDSFLLKDLRLIKSLFPESVTTAVYRTVKGQIRKDVGPALRFLANYDKDIIERYVKFLNTYQNYTVMEHRHSFPIGIVGSRGSGDVKVRSLKSRSHDVSAIPFSTIPGLNYKFDK